LPTAIWFRKAFLIANLKWARKRKVKELKKRLEELEEEEAQPRNYLFLGATLLLGIASVTTGGGDPGGYW